MSFKENDFEFTASQFLAICYALMFMISLYCQIFCSWRWRSSSGLSFDFIQFTLFGYVCFTIVSCGMFFSDNAQTHFENNHPYTIFPVYFSDIILSFNGIIFSLILMMQHIRYRRDMVTKQSVLGLVLIILAWFTFISITIIAIIPGTAFDRNMYYQALSIMFFVSVVFRYPPQISLIFRLRSIKGWSMQLVYFELLGIFFICCLITFNTTIVGSWEWFVGSIIQLLFIIVIIFYSLVIILQRYTLCTDTEEIQSRREIIKEHKILSERICYDVDDTNLTSIDKFVIFDDYTPSDTSYISDVDENDLLI